MKPRIWSSPYLVIVKSNMAAERGPTHLTSCNSLSTLYRVTNLVSLLRYSWLKNQIKRFSKMSLLLK